MGTRARPAREGSPRSSSEAGGRPQGQGDLVPNTPEAQNHFRFRQRLVASQSAGAFEALEILRARDIRNLPPRSCVVKVIQVAAQRHLHAAEVSGPGGGLVWGLHPRFPLVRR